ncbi:mannitol dehydrogenase family protein, partial [Actinomyces naeslundii]
MSTGIVHIGVGGFHRAHEAACLDSLMRRRAGSAAPEAACLDWGICGVGLLPGDTRMRDALAGQGHLYTLVRKHPGGLRDPAVIGSIHDYLFAPDDPEAVLSLLSAPSTRIVSLTITEGGYNVDDTTGEFHVFSPGAVHDAEHPGEPTTAFGYIVEALRRRREAGTVPFTVLSCDNLPGNGKVARTAVVSQAAMSDPELADWIDGNVAFPSCM